MNKPELINKYDKVKFFYNATKINFDDKTKIEDFFLNLSNPKIVVNDSTSLIGG